MHSLPSTSQLSLYNQPNCPDTENGQTVNTLLFISRLQIPTHEMMLHR